MLACIGIDVSKAVLDVAVHGSPEVRTFANSPAGYRQLAAWLIPHQPHQVVLEATGGYEQAALDALFAAGLPMSRVNPRQVRDFAKAIGQLAKTDRLDARVLAQLAALFRSRPTSLAKIGSGDWPSGINVATTSCRYSAVNDND